MSYLLRSLILQAAMIHPSSLLSSKKGAPDPKAVKKEVRKEVPAVSSFS
jgi:hypothetical protein